MNFGKRLKYLRENIKMNQSTLAEKLGLAPSTISMYEKGERDPDTDTLIKIAEIFNVTTDYLLGRTNISNITSEPLEIAASTKNNVDLSEVSDRDKEIIMNIIKTSKKEK